MALSNAERQKRWRERQKVKNKAEFLEKERIRRKNRYIPVAELTEKELKKRRAAINIHVKNHYRRKKEALKTAIQANESPNSAGTRNKSTSEHTPLLVKLPSVFPNRAKGVRKTYQRALKNANRKVGSLQSENTSLRKANKKLQKRIERLRRKFEKEETAEKLADEQNMTPRKKTDYMMKKDGLSSKKHVSVRRQLLLANTLLYDIKQVRQHGKMKTLLTYCNLVKKYRCVSILSKALKIHRRSKALTGKTNKRNSQKAEITAKVGEFLEREDNSTTLPGKKDHHRDKESQEIKQKRVLTDYLHNLHNKFLLENPGVKVCRSMFYQMKPSNIVHANFSSRRTCLCSKHQNLCLKLKCLRNNGIQASRNPDVFLKEYDSNDKILGEINEKCTEEVKYFHWKRVQECEKLRWKEVEEKISKTEFKVLFDKELTEFRNHVQRVQTQYIEMRRLRENLQEGNIMIWMDFAENYICSAVEEIQSAYWNSAMVSLHTMVVYFPEGHTKKLQSIVAVSDLLHHNATTVLTILRKTIPIVKEDYPILSTVHYLTDSPTSQYRNRFVFQILANHEADFGIKSRWNYLEAGHGKGPCDGLGASVKRSADQAVKQGKCNIQGASDFYAWGVHCEESGSKVKYVFYDQNDYDSASNELQSREKPKSIPGTMKLHAVVPSSVDPRVIFTRELSCNCKKCIDEVDNTQCIGWKQYTLFATDNQIEQQNQNAESSTIDTCEPDEVRVDVEIDKFVAAIYNANWFIGVITDIDETECQINFMSEAGKYRDMLKWPTTRDEIWIPKTQVLLILEKEPEPHGRSRRCFKISTETKQMIENEFEIRYGRRD